MKNETDEILEALNDKEPEKKPTNWQLWSALYFAEAVFVVLDLVSAVTVGYLTGYWYYGAFVFLAGVVPLFLYTNQYTRPLASTSQRKTAFVGGVIAVASVILVAVFMAFINLASKTMSLDAVAWTEAGLVISMIILLGVHAFVMGRYFFIDEEISENQKTNRILARGFRGMQRLGVANKIAQAKRAEVQRKVEIEQDFDPRVIARILNVMRDMDGDGIPDVLDPKDNRTGKPFNRQQSYAQSVEHVEEKGGNGNRPSSGQR